MTVVAGDALRCFSSCSRIVGPADVGIERSTSGGGGEGGVPRMFSEQPDAADHRRGVDAVGRHGQHARLAEQAAAAAVAQRAPSRIRCRAAARSP